MTVDSDSSAQATRRIVGVLGGMGPDATVDLMQRVIALTPAADDRDHIHMLVDNNPQVPSRIEALIEGTGPSPEPALIEMAQGLAAQGADFLVMPCNSAHYYHAQVAAAVEIPFLNLMELVAKELKAKLPGRARVGLLASSALKAIQLYESVLGPQGFEVIYPQEALQDALMDLIRAVKAGQVDDRKRAALSSAAANLAASGAEVLVVACTELSVVGDPLATTLPVVDAADVLARAVFAAAGDATEVN